MGFPDFRPEAFGAFGKTEWEPGDRFIIRQVRWLMVINDNIRLSIINDIYYIYMIRLDYH